MNSRRSFLSGISSAAVSLSFTRRSNAWPHHGSSLGFDVFALFGQSNSFGGYGGYDPAIDIGDPKLFAIKQDHSVVLGIDPLDFPGTGGGTTHIGNSVAFARDKYIPRSLAVGRNVLLVPGATGGVGFSNGGAVGGTWYENFVALTNAAMAVGSGTNVLKGFFYQGGEEDQFRYTQAQYIALFQAMASDFRSRVTGASSVPILIGGESPATTTHFGFTVDTQTYLQNMPASVTNSYYVDTFLPTPLTTDNRIAGVDFYAPNDYIHFDCPSQRTLGARYHAAGVANGLWAG